MPNTAFLCTARLLTPQPPSVLVCRLLHVPNSEKDTDQDTLSLNSAEETQDVSTHITVNLDMKITSSPLPPDIQRAVDEDLEAVSSIRHGHDRHMVRHWKLDSRDSLKKSKKKQLRAELKVTPFFLIGAYQVLLNRVSNRSTFGVADKNIQNASIPFHWFERMAMGFSRIDGQNVDISQVKGKGDPNESARLLIVNEAMALWMRPLVAPYLPPYAWSLMADPPAELKKGFKTKLEMIGRTTVDYDTGRHHFLYWDLTEEDGHVALETDQLKRIVNMSQPYVSHFYCETLFKLFKCHSQKKKKRSKLWVVTKDETSSLPALLIDMLLLHLDYSKTLTLNPLWSEMKNCLASDRKKQRIGVIKTSKIPMKLDGSAHMDYHRLGPIVLLAYHGPAKLQEKIQRAISLELKSALRFDKRIVNNTAFSEQKPKKKLTKRDKQELAELEAAFEEQQKAFDIAAAGTKPTRNPCRLKLQEEGRRNLNAPLNI